MQEPDAEINFNGVECDEIQFHLPEGISVAGKCWGDDRATINVVAMHGYLDSAATFDRLAPILVQQSHYNIRIVAFDFSGQGKSSHRADHTNYFISWVSEVVTVADAMGWSTFHLLAHSMATGIAVMLAGALPARIERVVLLDHIGPASIEPEQAPKYLERALQQRLKVLHRQPKTYSDTDALVKRMMESDAKLTEGSAKLLVARCGKRVANGVRFSHDPRLRGVPTAVPLTEPEVLEFIRRINVPVLLIWASYRWYPLDKKKFSAREQAFPNLRIEQVEGNHHVHLENPERVYPTILEFLTQPSSSL